MRGRHVNTVLFYAGLLTAAGFLVGVIAAAVLFHIQWLRLSRQLDEEYGKEPLGSGVSRWHGS